jgi:asparagine synthase (glutamine-hydrolysing)
MCGICGIVDRDHATPIPSPSVRAMRSALAHRGPDDEGLFLAPGVALGSRRLAILDLSDRGHMPMQSRHGRYWLTYNGEIYNWRDLRTGLEGRGHSFRSLTDTEVVLALYEQEGPSMLDRLNGMFAIAIWDAAERTLFLARDRLGIKPLYYAVREDRLYFASEEKSLFAGGVPREFNRDVWDELWFFRYVAGDRTPFVGVKRLLPGHYLLWRDGKARVRRWWNLAERALTRRETLPSDVGAWFQETLDDAVDLRRISDVPVGVLLSGGLDSGSVAASLAARESRTASFTVRFSEDGYDEGPLARQVADRWGLEQHELTVPGERLLPLLLHASWLNDEPLVHSNYPHLLAISQYAKSRVTVLLSGEGGDELLGGYVRYQPLRYPRLLNLARPVFPQLCDGVHLKGRLRKLADFLRLGSNELLVLFNACELLPTPPKFSNGNSPRFAFREEVLAEARGLYPGEYLRQAMYCDQHTFLCSILDRNDRMTMGASIECRVPFLDYRLVETLAALPSEKLFPGPGSKPLLRRIARQRLPRPVLRHRKWGFGVPWGKYLRSVPELRECVRNLPRLSFIREGPFQQAGLHTLMTEFLLGADRHEPLVKQLLLIAVWHQVCFGRPQSAIRDVRDSQFTRYDTTAVGTEPYGRPTKIIS